MKKVEVATVKVTRGKEFHVSKLSARSRKELACELAAAVAGGFKVENIRREGEKVKVSMSRAEDWSTEDVLAEIDALLEDCC